MMALRGKITGGRVYALVLVLAIAVGTASAGAYYFFILQDQSDFQDPVYGEETSTETFTKTLYPGQSTSAGFVAGDEISREYVVGAELKKYEDTDGHTGVEAARNKTYGAYIDEYRIGGANYTYDLLNDGYAQYDYLGQGNVSGTLRLSALEEGRINESGNVTVEVGFLRATEGPPEDSPVVMHREDFNSTDCDSGGCHSNMSKYENQHVPNTITVTSVHTSLNASDCESCHGRSSMDVHMDCTSACHEEGFWHDGPKYTTNDFTCANRGCHGDDNIRQLGYTHQEQGVYICESCHSEGAGDWTVESDDSSTDIMDAHTWGPPSEFEDCASCHGLGSNGMHEEYESSDCQNCHEGAS